MLLLLGSLQNLKSAKKTKTQNKNNYQTLDYQLNFCESMNSKNQKGQKQTTTEMVEKLA